MAMLNSILAILFWNVTMIVSPHALRYIDPSWDNESRNGKLYPALFYILRMAKRKNNDWEKENEKESKYQETVKMMMLI